MTSEKPAMAPVHQPRAPRAFRIEDVVPPQVASQDATASIAERRGGEARARALTSADVRRGVRWGAILFSAMASLAALAIAVWFTQFVSAAVARNDWVGWLASGLLAVMAVAFSAVVIRELWGLRRLARLEGLRKRVRAVVANPDNDAERKAVATLLSHYSGRADMAWARSRVSEHAGDVLEDGELLRLADRELLAPVDAEARRVILRSAKRIATATALSPILWLAMGYVLYENLRMFRAIAGLYGGRPGVIGGLRLARWIVGHVIATGGIAMTDDLLGQFLGQDVLRRLSRRLGEGAFNGALTARLGVVAVEVTRPLPFLDAPPLRIREIFTELMRSLRATAAGEESAQSRRSS